MKVPLHFFFGSIENSVILRIIIIKITNACCNDLAGRAVRLTGSICAFTTEPRTIYVIVPKTSGTVYPCFYRCQNTVRAGKEDK